MKQRIYWLLPDLASAGQTMTDLLGAGIETRHIHFAGREGLDLTDPATDAAMAHVESFCAIAVRVFAKTNPSKIRSEALTVEISARLAGRECLED